jgi:hypothetical protein
MTTDRKRIVAGAASTVIVAAICTFAPAPLATGESFAGG